MRKLEYLALVIFISLVSTNFLSWFGNTLFVRFYGPTHVGVSNAQLKWITTARSLLSIPVNLAVGIWLSLQAKKSNSTPWIWLLFGLVYGLIAAALFFLVKLHESRGGADAGVQLPDKTV